MEEIKCPNCGYEGLPVPGGSIFISLFLFATTWFLLWIPAILYTLLSAELKCPKCGYKNVIKLSEKEIKEGLSGEKLERQGPNLCPHCGKYYQSNPNFCPNCGAKLKD